MSGPFKTKGKSKRPGGGGRFAAQANAIYGKQVAEGKSPEEAKKSAGAITAADGRRKYGKKRFQEMAAAGRRRAEKK